MKDQEYKITSSEEYSDYLTALCKLSSCYVTRIRKQFAEKAYDKYQDETTRRLVLAYGEELEKLEADRVKRFTWATRDEDPSEILLDDDILNNATHLKEVIKMLFEIL